MNEGCHDFACEIMRSFMEYFMEEKEMGEDRTIQPGNTNFLLSASTKNAHVVASLIPDLN